MKENTDLFTLAVGLIASIMKGIKKKLNLRLLIIAGVSGAILSWGTLGVLEYFMSDMDIKVAILTSFIVGWIANEITEVLDEIVKDAYDVLHAWFKDKFSKK